MPIPPLHLTNNQVQNPISGLAQVYTSFNDGPIIYGRDITSTAGGIPTPASIFATDTTGAGGDSSMLWLLAAGAVLLFVLMEV